MRRNTRSTKRVLNMKEFPEQIIFFISTPQGLLDVARA